MNKNTLYQVKGYEGAHLLIDTLNAGKENALAVVHLIGAQLSYTCPPTDVTPYNMEQPIPAGKTIYELAQRAAIQYRLDPDRIQRATNLAIGEGVIERNGVLLVKSSVYDYGNNQYKRYTVSKGACNCVDSAKGNICKHRIAAWMYREMHGETPARSDEIYVERRYCDECMKSHWQEIPRWGGAICHGEDFAPTQEFAAFRRSAHNCGKGFYIVPHNLNMSAAKKEASHV